LFARVAILFFGLVIAGFAVAYLRTGNPRHLRHAVRALIAGLITALLFFIGLFIERLLYT
jgi:hypothetical protein